MSHAGFAMHHVPTLSERMWRALGFRYHYGEEPEGIDKLEGWMRTETRMRFGFLDRLRLLLTGHLHISLTQHTPVQCDYSINRVDWQIVPFGGK
jgi:hypothetical protein